ncbi:uncharacterized protein LOC132179366 [Corylus avellana]|uniref:uncharacterized protein LOC132179366 n=1 Tax=Corylus avellana TaxID=13451 RepID=UPI00286A29DE|nr:uncharacterized protein LOC132179366 [Corylus avellana]
MASESSFVSDTNTSAVKLSVSSSLKRKRPPKIEIPSVLQEIQTDRSASRDSAPQDDAVCLGEIGVGVSSVKGKKKFMEDTHKILPCLQGKSNKGFFGVYDGHGGNKAAEFVAENLHTNILEMMENCKEPTAKEEAVKSGYIKTDQEFLKQGLGSGACCVTALIEGQEVVISNVGDCRAVLCRRGVAEALTRDHRVEQEDERKRIEDKGGYVEIHRGAWRVHGVLSVSRSIGDAHLKDWVLAEPDTKILKLTPDMEFLVLASDGLWEEVGNQEAVDTVKRLCPVEKRLGPSSDLQKDNDDGYGCVNVSPTSSKLRRISLVKQPKGMGQSPSYNKTVNRRKGIEDDFASENESPPPKSRRISLVKRVNMKTESPSKENISYKRRPPHGGLVAACKELVNLAVSRGSLDDITVMIIDLNHFRCIPACFSSGESPADDPATVIRSGQSVSMSVYRTKIAGQCRLITITWCKDMLQHGLSVSVRELDGDEHHRCKVELKPWYFWRKQGSKHFMVDGKTVYVVWDLKAAKFNGETEPQTDYYVAIVCEEEVVLAVGDLKKDAFRKTGCRPALIEPTLVSRKEHLFGKKKFSTRAKFQEKGNIHELSIECKNAAINSDNSLGGFDPQMEIRIDGNLAIHIKHLQWKFRGNESISVSKIKVEVYWDVHDWLFSSGTRHGLFIFRPISSSVSPSPSPSTPSSSLTSMQYLSTQEANPATREEDKACGSSRFSLFFYAWRVE